MREANFDGLPGPTHNYAGLAYGNLASQKNARHTSNPRAALMQGLEKMKLLCSLGVPQGVFPPHPRPDGRVLHALGFTGSIKQAMERVARTAPELLPWLYSSSGMWAANAATVTPSSDSAKGCVHFTPANLCGTAHRAFEPAFTTRMLTRIFSSSTHFIHHPALPASALVADEGAANHMRLHASGEDSGFNLFVYGRNGTERGSQTTFPARQSLHASKAVARLHGLNQERCLFLQQSLSAIDAGVFHNDVIAVSHGHLLLMHASAYENPAELQGRLKESDAPWHVVQVEERELSLADAVSSYLFNSQIVSTLSGGMAMIVPQECRENAAAWGLIDRWRDEVHNPISEVHVLDLRQSMRNGGGPACLRLRVPLTSVEWGAVHDGVKYTPALHKQLAAWGQTYYRDVLSADDLRDPALAIEALTALEALEEILHLKGLYHGEH